MRLILSILLFMPLSSMAEVSIGKLVKSEGIITKTNISCQGPDCTHKKNRIYPGDRILTEEGSKVSILLDEGTALIIYGHSDIFINRVRLKERDKPTEIYIEKGSIKVIQRNRFLDISLIVKTPVSVIKSVNSELNIVSGRDETALFVYSGKAGFAGLTLSRDRAYILDEGDESFIQRDEEPSDPVKVDRVLRNSWLGRYLLSDDGRRIIRYNKKSGPADWPFIKND